MLNRVDSNSSSLFPFFCLLTCMLKGTRAFSSTSRILNANVETLAKIAKNKNFLAPLYAQPPVIFSKGQGCYVYDLTGKKYLDLAAGIAVNALGHNDPDVVKSITEQASLIHMSNLYYNEHAGDLAELLVGLMGSKENNWKVFLSNSGTEANEAALKFAKKYGNTNSKKTPNKNHIVSFTNAFHGRSLGSLSATPTEKYQTPFLPILPGFRSSPLNDIAAADKIINEQTCGILVEPIQGEGGIHSVHGEFMKYLRKKADEVDALLIFDEIQCGLGRTGTIFAHEHYKDIKPDIVTLAKPLANGIPIGATIVSEKVWSILKVGDHGTTFGGSPFASKVATTVLKKISNPSFLKNVVENGAYFTSELKKLVLMSPLLTEVRGKGLMIGLQLADGVNPTHLIDSAMQKGMLIISAGGNTIRIVPPLIITKSEIDAAISILKRVLTEVEAARTK